MARMTKGDRSELRSVVKQQFRVLRSEVRARAAELEAQGEHELAERYQGIDQAREDVQWKVNEIVQDANRQIEDVIKAKGDEVEEAEEGPGFIQQWYQVHTPRITWAPTQRGAIHHAMTSRIESQVQDALHKLDRQEADLLRDLAIDALEGEAARDFLNTIPSVAELVPGARMAELEAEFGAPGEPPR